MATAGNVNVATLVNMIISTLKSKTPIGQSWSRLKVSRSRPMNLYLSLSLSLSLSLFVPPSPLLSLSPISLSFCSLSYLSISLAQNCWGLGGSW